MARYRTKEFWIDAVQYTGDPEVAREVFPDVNLDIDEALDGTRHVVVWDYLQETWVTVNDNDFIIKGMRGEFYPCAQDVFEAKYERVV